MQPVFWYDFGSPNAWMAFRVLPRIEERTGVRFAHVPVLLGGLFKLAGNQAPMLAFQAIPAKLRYQQVEMARFLRRHRLTGFVMNPHFPVNTLMLMRGAVAAEAEGLAAAYEEAMFRGMWEEGLKLDDPDVLARALAAAGLPAERLMALAQDPAIKDRLVANTAEAHAKGAFGIPTFLVHDEIFFGKDQLHDVEAELAEARSPGS